MPCRHRRAFQLTQSRRLQRARGRCTTCPRMKHGAEKRHYQCPACRKARAAEARARYQAMRRVLTDEARWVPHFGRLSKREQRLARAAFQLGQERNVVER